MTHNINLTRTPEELSELFFNLKTNDDIAHLLEISPNTLIYYAYRIDEKEKYKEFSILKRSGKQRRIYSPTTGLKIIQSKLNKILQEVYIPTTSAYAYIKSRNVISNARIHTRSRFLLNLDLVNFFESINFGRIRGLLMSYPFSFNNEVATTLANLCCHKGCLPQGAPTSPILSNMICRRMDLQLLEYAKSCNSLYTRYADDISLSARSKNFPQWFGQLIMNKFELNPKLNEIIKKNGFVINMDKVRISDNNHRQMVTGLIVNKKVNIKRKFYRQLRAMIHARDVYGLIDAQKEFLFRWDIKNRPIFKNPLFDRVIQGKINFLKDVKGGNDTGVIKLSTSYKLSLLKDAFIKLHTHNFQLRGYALEKILHDLFALHKITCQGPFIRREGAEQIDGAFMLNGTHYLLECKWKKEVPSDDVDRFMAKVNRSGDNTFGLFLSINGWAPSTLPNLKENRTKKILLMNGDDLNIVLDKKVSLQDLLKHKIHELNVQSNPFFSAGEFLTLTTDRLQ